MFNDAAKGGLRLLCHHVRFVEDNELETLGEQRARFCKLLDLFADNVNSSVIRGIKLTEESGHEQPHLIMVVLDPPLGSASCTLGRIFALQQLRWLMSFPYQVAHKTKDVEDDSSE